MTFFRGWINNLPRTVSSALIRTVSVSHRKGTRCLGLIKKLLRLFKIATIKQPKDHFWIFLRTKMVPQHQIRLNLHYLIQNYFYLRKRINFNPLRVFLMMNLTTHRWLPGEDDHHWAEGIRQQPMIVKYNRIDQRISQHRILLCYQQC